MRSVVTVDVEDWFHILDVPGAPAAGDWERLPSRVEHNFSRLLDLLSEGRAQATCFFLGWVAERHPHLVREAAGRGHEIASHGYLHRLVYRQGREGFREDAARSRKVLEDITGKAVRGYRSAGFSLTAEVPWFFDELVGAGYCYDSSLFPALRGHGGIAGSNPAPHWVRCENGEILEFPITVARVLGRPMCFFGGGYLRLFPYALVRAMGRRVLREGRPVVFYVHPREIDPGHPRMAMNPLRRFKSYVNLGTTEGKISAILRDFEVTSFERLMADNTWKREGQ